MKTKTITTHHISAQSQLGDISTKALKTREFETFLDKMEICDMPQC